MPLRTMHKFSICQCHFPSGWHAETYFTDEDMDGVSYCVARCSRQFTLSYILHLIFEVRPGVIVMNKIRSNEKD